jgi:methylaspartate mutase epsilon subunit
MNGRDGAPRPRHDFGGFVRRVSAGDHLVVQPRMGFSDPALMRRGLRETARLGAATAGTITLDSYTRVGDYRAIQAALTRGERLNGYPIVTTHPDVTAAMTHELIGADFQIQVRHGSPAPLDIVRAMSSCGLYATEGGPLSYCLPYSRLPIAESVDNWRRCCETLASLRGPDVEPHLETFGGCLMGQMCPPSLLIAVSVLEAMFFRQHGLRSISLSYAQQIDHGQDLQALAALRMLAGEYLRDADWHLVLYSYMGVYPATRSGAKRLAESSARLAAQGGAERLIVKTTAEAHRIPTIAENVRALRDAARHVETTVVPRSHPAVPADDNEVLAEARVLIEATLELSADVGTALVASLRCGLLDVPYCLHPDNAGQARSYIDRSGRLAWSRGGAMPLRAVSGSSPELSSSQLLSALSVMADRYDRAAGASSG